MPEHIYRPGRNTVEERLRLPDPQREVEVRRLGLARRAAEADEVAAIEMKVLAEGRRDRGEIRRDRGARTDAVDEQQRPAGARFVAADGVLLELQIERLHRLLRFNQY